MSRVHVIAVITAKPGKREEVLKLNLATGVPMVYRLNADSTVASKDVLGDMSGAH